MKLIFWYEIVKRLAWSKARLISENRKLQKERDELQAGIDRLIGKYRAGMQKI